MRTPNLVIAGAPKCGSTSLYYYLDSHPEACGSDVKETCFLMDREFLMDPANAAQTHGPTYHTDGLDAYSRVFTRCKGGNVRIWFEASPGYLYQQTALEVLPQLDPPAKLVFVLRKPSARIWSLYKYATGNLSVLPQEMSFPEFVQWLKMPRNKNSKIPIAQGEFDYSKYIKYLLPFKERCQEGQILIYLAEHLKRHPERVMNHLCHAIGIDTGFYDTYAFIPHNESFRAKNQWLQRMRVKLSHTLPRSRFRQTRTFKALLHFYQRLNANAPLKLSEADQLMLAELDEEYRPYSEQLATAFDLDLSAWGIPLVKKEPVTVGFGPRDL